MLEGPIGAAMCLRTRQEQPILLFSPHIPLVLCCSFPAVPGPCDLLAALLPILLSHMKTTQRPNICFESEEPQLSSLSAISFLSPSLGSDALRFVEQCFLYYTVPLLLERAGVMEIPGGTENARFSGVRPDAG